MEKQTTIGRFHFWMYVGKEVLDLGIIFESELFNKTPIMPLCRLIIAVPFFKVGVSMYNKKFKK